MDDIINEEEFCSVIQADGFQFDNERQDLSGDGNQEFVVTSVDISLGTVLKALITRAVSLDISIYTIKAGKFSSAPSIRKTISAKFDFSSGDLFVPAVLGADITGDVGLVACLRATNHLRPHPSTIPNCHFHSFLFPPLLRLLLLRHLR